MEYGPVVEARVEELSELNMNKFMEVVRREIDGGASSATKKALGHPILSRRWLRAIGIERRSIVKQLSTLKKDRSFKDKAALDRLDKYILALDEKYADVEWRDKRNTVRSAQRMKELKEQCAAAEKELDAKREALGQERKALRLEWQALRRELEPVRRLLQSKADLDKLAQVQPGKDFKRQAIAELARRHPDEFKSILSELLTDGAVEFAEADVQRALEKLIT